MTVLLDSNFLLVPSTLRIDIFSEIERTIELPVRFVVIDSVLHELETRAEDEKHRGTARHFRHAMSLAGRCDRETVPDHMENMSVDEQLLEYAKVKGYVIATNDRELRRRSRDLGLTVITLREGKKVIVIGAVP
ncbi:MAG: hypothetical protein QXS20_02135 [Candidatus Thorarchaeota archaeon]